MGNVKAKETWSKLSPLNLTKLVDDQLLVLEEFEDQRGYLRFKERIETFDGEDKNLHSGQFNEAGLPHGISRMVIDN